MEVDPKEPIMELESAIDFLHELGASFSTNVGYCTVDHSLQLKVFITTEEVVFTYYYPKDYSKSYALQRSCFLLDQTMKTGVIITPIKKKGSQYNA